MLLSKTIKIKWNRNTCTYYKNKGYKFTKIGDEFEVNVKDLKDGSNALVFVKCDNEKCKNEKIKSITWKRYKQIVKFHKGYYYCASCSQHYKKQKIKDGESFYNWCIANNRQDILDRWDYDLNNKEPNEICYSSHKKYYFKCPKGLHSGELQDIHSFIRRKNGSIKCKQCNSFAQWGIDNLGKDFLEKYWDYDKNNKLGINPWEISYGNNRKVYIKCQEKDYHDSYYIKCHDFNQNHRCPYCRGLKVHPQDSLGQYIINNYGKEFLDKIWSNKNKKSPFKYSPNSHSKVWWKCFDEKHKDYYRSANRSINLDYRCPECSRERKESILQEKVRLYLESLNNGEYTILHEYNCTIVPNNPKTQHSTNHFLPFDNEVKELKLIIEVNGMQHYKEGNGYFKSNCSLHYQQVKDRYKRIFAKSKGYNYIVIPCWTDDKKETWKQLIDDKIKEILNKQDEFNN